MTNNTDRPAFPPSGFLKYGHGLTKLELFAVMIAQGMSANSGDEYGHIDDDDLAQMAVSRALTLLSSLRTRAEEEAEWEEEQS